MFTGILFVSISIFFQPIVQEVALALQNRIWQNINDCLVLAAVKPSILKSTMVDIVFWIHSFLIGNNPTRG